MLHDLKIEDIWHCCNNDEDRLEDISFGFLENWIRSVIDDFIQAAQGSIFVGKDMVIFALKTIDFYMLWVVDHDHLGNKQPDHIFVEGFWSIGALSCLKHPFNQFPQKFFWLLRDLLNEVIFSGDEHSLRQISDQGSDKELTVIIETIFEKLISDSLSEGSDDRLHLFPKMAEDWLGNGKVFGREGEDVAENADDPLRKGMHFR